MFNPEQESESLNYSIEQLRQNQQVVAKMITLMKCQLDNLTEEFNNRPEAQQLASLNDALAQLQRQVEEHSA